MFLISTVQVKAVSAGLSLVETNRNKESHRTSLLSLGKLVEFSAKRRAPAREKEKEKLSRSLQNLEQSL